MIRSAAYRNGQMASKGARARGASAKTDPDEKRRDSWLAKAREGQLGAWNLSMYFVKSSRTGNTSSREALGTRSTASVTPTSW